MTEPVEAGYEGKEVLKLLAHKCEACGKGSPTKHGLHIHEARWCGWSERMSKGGCEESLHLGLSSSLLSPRQRDAADDMEKHRQKSRTNKCVS